MNLDERDLKKIKSLHVMLKMPIWILEKETNKVLKSYESIYKHPISYGFKEKNISEETVQFYSGILNEIFLCLWYKDIKIVIGAFRIKNVTMKFNMDIEKDFSIKQAFINFFKGKKKKKGEYFYALKNVTFSVNKGDVVGLIGSNGAGKSTLLKVVSGVMKPTSGKVEVDGVISPMIELGAGFDMNLTARENIYLNGAILGYSKKFLDSKFDEIVEFSELKDFLDVPVKNFSSGMTAKLAFSIATIVDPEILIVDEILSVGDLRFQEKSKNKMMEMIKGGTTVLYVSHSLESIKELCNKVIWLNHGQIVKMGDTKEICDEYYKEQMKNIE